MEEDSKDYENVNNNNIDKNLRTKHPSGSANEFSDRDSSS